MLLELSKLKNLPVGSFDEAGLIGVIRRVLIDKEDGRAIGFLIKLTGFLSSFKVASFQDVVDIDQAGLVLRSAESLVEQNEIVRISEIINANFKFIGLAAYSKEKKYLGRVYDALIDSNTGDIIRVYVKHFFADYVFERSQIEEITSKMVKLRTEKRQRAKRQAEALAHPEIA